jgi:hypothetical protein
VRSGDGRIIQCRFSVQLIESCHEKYLLINMEDVTEATAAEMAGQVIADRHSCRVKSSHSANNP